MFLSRRQLLIDGLKVSALVPVCCSRFGGTSRTSGERVLVVVQLTGGNDGLNTVVPFSQDAYFRLRPTLALKRSSLHALDGDHGLHPSLKELGPLFDEGRMTIVQGVGYPHANRSHFRSLEIWHSADPDGPPKSVGWLGRMADQIVAAAPGSMPGMHVGDEDLPLALMGRRVLAPSVNDESSLQLTDLPGLERERLNLLVDEPDAHGELAFLRSAARNAYETVRRLETSLGRAARTNYPDHPLARKLRLIAQLVSGGFDTRLFLVTLGGFDTHARQAAQHAALLEQLGSSLSTFQRDLHGSGEGGRVLTLVFSEFGRRAEENASRGTDHGAAAPVLLLGGPGPGGLRGSPPDLDQLIEGDIGHTTDFRSLYTTIERDWMGLEPSSAAPGFDLGD